MSFWGPTQTAKNALTGLGQIPPQVLAQAQQGNTNALLAWGKAQGLSDQYVAQLTQQIQSGIGSPGDIRALGQWATPVNTAPMDQNVQTELDNYNNVLPNVADTTGTIDTALNNKGQRIGQNYQDVQGAIDNGFGTQRNTNALATTALQGNINSTYPAVQDAASKAFGTASTNAAGTFGKVGQNSTDAYNAVQNRIAQSRDFANGTTARAFAPEMASTLRSIRAEGIDPNSPQAQSLIQSVNTQRGRAFDDNMGNVIAQQNAATLGQQQNQQGLDLSQLSNEQQLELTKAANAQGLTLQQYADQQGLTTKTAADANALTQGNMVANVNNANAAFQEGQNFYDQQAQNAQTDRGLNLQDQAAKNSLIDKQTQQDLIDQGLLDKQFNTGLQYQGQNLNRVDAGTAQLGPAANQQFGAGATQGAQSTANYNLADNGFGASYNAEAPQGAWGVKLLTGLAGAALPYVLPTPAQNQNQNNGGGGGGNSWLPIFNQGYSNNPLQNSNGTYSAGAGPPLPPGWGAAASSAADYF